MEVIRNHDFRVTSEMIKDLLEIWDTEWRREELMRRRNICCLAATMVIGFCGGLRGDEVFLTSLKGILKLWEEKEMRKTSHTSW